MLLHFDLLEFDELGPPGLQVEAAAGAIGGAHLTGTHQQRHEGG